MKAMYDYEYRGLLGVVTGKEKRDPKDENQQEEFDLKNKR
jgi:hypothetical protein